MRYRTKECHPVLYAMNARVQLTELTLSLGRAATLKDIPEQELDHLAELGVDFLWLIGVWRTGDSSKKVARDYEGLQFIYRQTLSDFSSEDILGSPYAIAGYNLDSLIGGEDHLRLFRERLSKRGIRLILDFIVNHTGLDHRWIYEHPEYYIQGTISDAEQAPNDFFQVETVVGQKIIAHGRDPFFPPWTDTAQLNLSSNVVQEELRRELLSIAKNCDGVRCDMAMLSFQSIIQKTWGDRPLSSIVTQIDKSDFWDTAIREVKEYNHNFIFIAEAYWDTEYKLRCLGFDYTYDKILHNRLIHEDGRAVRAHLGADVSWQAQTVRFLENHDEERIAHALSFNRHVAAAVIFSTLPGMLLIHDGQLEGRKVKHPVQLRRRYKEPLDETVHFFYEKLFFTLKEYKVRHGSWMLSEVRSAWEGNFTWENFIAYTWQGDDHSQKIIIVNYGPTQGQCYVSITGLEFISNEIIFEDIVGRERYIRRKDEVVAKGMYIDIPSYAFHIFAVN